MRRLALRPLNALARKVLTEDSLPERVRRVEYAVRGPIVQRAEELEAALARGGGGAGAGLPFERVTYCNIGNPQQLGQPPLTYLRQTLALVEAPELIDVAPFPDDIHARARRYLAGLDGGSTGAYSKSAGVGFVREEVARFIARRDGRPAPARPGAGDYADPATIFLSDGASPAVQACLRLVLRGAGDGVLLPVPQYPLYSAAIPLLGGTPLPVYLHEDAHWRLPLPELHAALQRGHQQGVTARALVVINPGNPTGGVLPEENMHEIVAFCEQHNLVLFADEVYQANVYGERRWRSFKSVVVERGSGVEVVSFHSTSKGLLGECGKRGGYVEFHGVGEGARAHYLKLASIALCPNVLGQLAVALMVDPPRPGEPSYARYEAERAALFASLQRRAGLVAAALNALPGVTCHVPEGAMYAFPQITLPPKALEAAAAAGRTGDGHYCLELLEATGLCVVPGSGFGQRPGTWHFRTTFLPPEAHLSETLARLHAFHTSFLQRYQ